MKRTFIYLAIFTGIISFTSCNPGERPDGASSSEKAIIDTIEAQHSKDSSHTDPAN